MRLCAARGRLIEQGIYVGDEAAGAKIVDEGTTAVKHGRLLDPTRLNEVQLLHGQTLCQQFFAVGDGLRRHRASNQGLLVRRER